MTVFISRVTAVVLMLLVSGCVGPAPKIEETTFATALGVDLMASQQVGGMYVRDVVVGTGAAAAIGSTLTVRYSGALANGSVFDANSEPSVPFKFRLGVGEVISGWDVGLEGMKVGGTRQLIIPPAMGYGVQGAPPAIPPNAILVFTVTLISA